MEKFSGTKTILLVGVGGQGTILAGKLLATVAAGAGLDVKVSEIHGMSQRGGSVSTVIRLGEHVSTMVCDDGCADVVVAFEAVEALRAQHYLAEGGKMFVNDEEITPVSVNIGNFTMPERVDERLREMGAHLLDAGVIARGLGTPRSTNVVLVGALSTALPFDVELWRDAVRACVPPATVEANLAAFDAGRDAALRGPASLHDGPHARQRRPGPNGVSDPLAVFCHAARRLLRHHGLFCCIFPAEDLSRLLSTLERERLGCRRILPLCPRAGEAAKRVLVLARKEAAAQCRLEAPLPLHDGQCWSRGALAFCPWLGAGHEEKR